MRRRAQAWRRALPYPERAAVHKLTDYGHDLEPGAGRARPLGRSAAGALGRWGARTMDEPRPLLTSATRQGRLAIGEGVERLEV